MATDLHAQNAALKNRITHLENVVRDHEIAEEKLQEIAGAAYQIVGVIASKAGVFDTPEIEQALDYLSQVKKVSCPLPFRWPEGHRTAAEWRIRERDLLEANTRYLLQSRHAEPLAQAIESLLHSSSGNDAEFDAARDAIGEYRKEFPA